MSAESMQHIPGVVAADDRFTVAATLTGALVAVVPTTGTVLWRRGSGLHPCSVTDEAVVAVRADDPQGPAVVVLDRSDGRELWTAPLPDVPDWARPVLAREPATSVRCAVEKGQVLLRWQADTRYEGGAAPPAQVVQEHVRHAEGVVRVDLRSRSVRPVEPGDAVTGFATDPATAESSAQNLGSDVLGTAQVGAVRLELAAPPGPAVVLRGVAEPTGDVLWQVVLDEPARRPPPLRP